MIEKRKKSGGPQKTAEPALCPVESAIFKIPSSSKVQGRAEKPVLPAIFPIEPDGVIITGRAENVGTRDKFNRQGDAGGVIKGGFEVMPRQNEDIANFKIFPEKRRVYIDRNGQHISEHETFDCRIVFRNGLEEFMEVRTSEIASIAKRVKTRCASAQLDYTQPGLAEKAIEAEFRGMVNSVPTVRILTEAGWQKLGGHWTYVHDGAFLPDGYEACTGLNLPNVCLSDADARTIFQNAVGLTKDRKKGLVLAIYSFMGIFYRVIKEAGISRPGFTLFINGRTGSMKTAISLILFNQLCTDQLRTTPRRIDMDTEASFELALCKTGCDTITLFDDYAPAKTRARKTQMADKLETIVRLVGDVGGKNRSNSNLEDVRSNGVQGLAVVTGEIKGKGESTNLRILYLFFRPNEANKDIVTWFQENWEAYPAFLNRFAGFVGSHWDELVGFVAREIPTLRAELAGYIEENRLVDTAALLSIASKVVCWFLREGCSCTQQETAALQKEMMEAIVDIVLESAEASRKESFSLMFLKAFLDLLHMDQIRFIEISEYGIFGCLAFAYVRNK